MAEASKATRFARARYRPYHLLLGFAALVLIATVVFALRATALLRENIAFVVQTQQVMRETTALLALLGDAEFYHRRYLVTSDPAQLPRYREATALLLGQLDTLRGLTLDNPEQLERITRIDEYVRAYDRASDQAVAVYQTQGDQAARELQARGEASAAGMAIRTAVRAMLDAENRLLTERQASMAAVLQQTGLTILVASALALAAASFGFLMIGRAMAARQRQLELEFEAQHAQRVSREKSAFLASMSHEFRTPMNAIFGFTQLLAALVRGQREQQYIRAIVASGKSLLGLINDVLDLSKIEAGRLELAPEPTDLRELIDQTLAVFSQMAAQKNLYLRADVDPELPPGLLLDPARLRQVLINLIGNAVKYTERGGIVLRCRTAVAPRDGACALEVAVEDTGVGIPEHMRERVFEPFVQSSGGDGRTREGTGLGLSITRRLVEAMGGELQLESAVGKGSRFLVRLHAPVTEAPRPERHEAWGDVDFGLLTPGTVLVVDDVEWNRELVAAYFEGSPHRLLFAADGEQAVVLAEQYRPDVVLMDIRMPRMDGREARDRIRACCGARIAIIAVTASTVAGEERALREDFDAFVRKPFSKRELYSAVSEFLPPRAEAPAPAQATEAGTEEAPPPELDPAERTRLNARLDVLLDEVWPRLRATLPMRETAALAGELRELGHRLGHRPLEAYGRRLAMACDNFDVGTVESLLHQLPSHLPPGERTIA